MCSHLVSNQLGIGAKISVTEIAPARLTQGGALIDMMLCYQGVRRCSNHQDDELLVARGLLVAGKLLLGLEECVA